MEAVDSVVGDNSMWWKSGEDVIGDVVMEVRSGSVWCDYCEWSGE